MRRLFPAVPSSDPDVHGPRPLPPILVKRHACHKRDAPRNASSTPACTRTRQQPALFHCASSRISCKIKNRGNLRYAANLDV
ncbi:hypothetical protein PUN28_018231 [Cardiocondyla obscurior]|uniref:Uncharacterized protein n=1 Tax=Cardiocondyla obscurior TaxID=286306 RepID=A0AAW2EK92_9HYME